MKKEDIFRDIKKWYLSISNCTSPHLIRFAVKNAGNRILDMGCATGEYCQKLNELGFRCIGVDVNPEYIVKAKEKDVEAYVMDGQSLDFPNNSFDTVLLFEVLEHVNNPDVVLEEAKRVAKKNVLVTVPNCTEFLTLRRFGLTYEHMLEKDHINFFTKKELEYLFSKHFKNFRAEEREPMALELIRLPWWLQYPILMLLKLKLIKTDIYFRLYAIAEAE